MNKPYISIVVPVFNEEGNVEELYQRVCHGLASFDKDFELIYVDDGSRDRTFEKIESLRKNDNRVKLVCFSRNFGHQVSFAAGIDYAAGEYIVSMDGDLQDPPEVIKDLVQKAEEGFDVVYAVRKKRPGESFLRNWIIHRYYAFFRRIADIPIPENVGDFRVINRRVCEKLKELQEVDPYLRGMVSWIGFKQAGLEYDREPRNVGKTKYPFSKLFKLAWDGITAFSTAPLRFATIFGFLVSSASFLYMAVVFLKYFHYLISPSTDRAVPGWATTTILILFLGGVQLISMGIIGEYIYRIYQQTKNRPRYIVERAEGFNEKLNDTSEA